MRGRVRAAVVVVAYLATVAMNVLANVLPLAGRETGAISAMYPIPFTPAGWVFSIWGVIYLALGVFAIWQALPARWQERWLDQVGWLFVASCVFNVGWLVAWHNLAIVISFLLMLGLLGCLLWAYRVIVRQRGGALGARLDSGSQTASDAGPAWAAQVPFSIYLGWITVATLANASVLLYELGWRPERGVLEAWSLALVLVAACIGGWVLARNRDVIYAAVLVWAFAGIAAKEWGATLLASAAIAAAVALAIMALWILLRRGRAAAGGAAG